MPSLWSSLLLSGVDDNILPWSLYNTLLLYVASVASSWFSILPGWFPIVAGIPRAVTGLRAVQLFCHGKSREFLLLPLEYSKCVSSGSTRTKISSQLEEHIQPTGYKKY